MLQALLRRGTQGGSGWAVLRMPLYLIKTGIRTGVTEALSLPAPVSGSSSVAAVFSLPFSLLLPELMVGTRLQQI